VEREPLGKRLRELGRRGLASALAYLFGAVVLGIVFDAAMNPPATTGEGFALAGKLLALFVALSVFAVWPLYRLKNK
jgi:hypothetical protein